MLKMLPFLSHSPTTQPWEKGLWAIPVGNALKDFQTLHGQYCSRPANDLVFHHGTWQNSGDPTSGSTGTGAIPISLTSDTGFWFMAANCNSSSNTAIWSHNYGNGYFGSTAVSSAGTNASNNGIFEYDVPAGYQALCTKGLNA